MHIRLLFIICCILFNSFLYGQVLITKESIERAKILVSQMTLEEKIQYISGYKDGFSIPPIPRLGLPEIKFSDGPQGLRNNTKSTMYPSGILSAATWNRKLNYQLGGSLGRDAKARGVDVLLGPGVNLYRSPLCGRNFEYFGEDPFLAGEVAKYYILGVQSEGVIATVKHFAANNQEWDRNHVSSEIDERTLHELYLAPFRKAVKEAHVGAVMNSYNLLNGVHTTESHWLNIDILRNKWNFKGFLVSDWGSVYSTVNAFNNGLDLEMPYGQYFDEKSLLPAMRQGVITEETLNLKVQHILQTLISFQLLNGKNERNNDILLNDSISKLTALQIAREGIVLLKNEGNILPLKGKTVVMGPNAENVVTGGGSGFVRPYSSISIVEGLKKMHHKNTICLSDSLLFKNINNTFLADLKQGNLGFIAEYFENSNFTGKLVTCIDTFINSNWNDNCILKKFLDSGLSARWYTNYIPQQNGLLRLTLSGTGDYKLYVNDSLCCSNILYEREKILHVKAGEQYKLRIEYCNYNADATLKLKASMLDEHLLRNVLQTVPNVVYCVGFNNGEEDGGIEGEGSDRPFSLPQSRLLMLEKVLELHDNVIVILNVGGGIDFSSWSDKAKAILMAWYMGQEGGQAVAEILTGKISPSGKLPISIESKLSDNPTANSYYENIPSAEYKRVQYSEGIFMGYRGFEKLKTKPLYPFGFGLSYTSFKYTDLQIKKIGKNKVLVSFIIKNTGNIDGSEIAQIYVRDVESSVPRPYKELKEYEKIFLKKGKCKTVKIELNEEAFSFYDMNEHQFKVEPGAFEILVGSSSEKVELKGNIML